MNKMEPIQDIIQIMQDLNNAHEDLLVLENLKKEALVHNVTDDLVQHLHEQSKVTKRISALEQARLQLVQQWLSQKGIQNGRMLLPDLIKLTPHHKDKECLRKLGQELQERIEKLRSLNQFNQQLIEQSLSYIDFALRLVTDEPEPFSTYEREERSGKATTDIRSFFDSRA